GAVAQYPVGWLADRIDRRQVLLLISALSVVICGLTAALTPSITTVFALSFFFGMVTLPVFSISAAHANDFATPDFIVELSAALMFLYALGAIVSPLLASSLMTLYGPGAMFLMIAAAHFVLVVFGLYRMTRRASPNAQAPYTYVPRTSFVLGWLLRRR
ncbi:MAG: MFS transporter, partial [Roseivivax sp.]|nr:MFS transporter [Roseivivax sp.]